MFLSPVNRIARRALRSRIGGAILALAAAGLPTPLVAEVTQVTLTSQPFAETWRAAAEISGSDLVGFTALPPAAQGELGVSADIPAHWRGQPLCLRVISADGRYEAKNSYQIDAAWTGGTLTLPYPSADPARLEALPPGSLAAALWQGACDQPEVRELALVRWRGGAEPVLLLNSGRAEETLLLFPDHPGWPEVLCHFDPAATQIAYDTRCALPAASGALAVQVIPFRRGEMGRTQTLTLHLAGG